MSARVKRTRPERSDRGSPTSSFCNQFLLLTIQSVFPGDVWAGNLLVFSKAWSTSVVYLKILTSSSSSSTRTVRTSHYQQNRARLKKPFGTVYRAHHPDRMFASETAFSRVIVESWLFREISVHFQPRVVRECQHRPPGSQTSRSRPPRFMVVGARATSLIGGAFQTCSSTCTRRSLAHVCVASRLAGRTRRGLSG